MAEMERPSKDHTTAPITPTNTGVVVGILIVLLITLGVYVFWKGTGYRDAEGRHPPKPADTAVTTGG
jgi:hypothetical protein